LVTIRGRYPMREMRKNYFHQQSGKKDLVREMLIEAELAHEECPKLNFRQPTPAKPTPLTMNRPNPDPPIMPIGKSNNRDKILRFIQDNKNANDDKSLP